MPVYEYVCRKCGAKNEFIEHLGGGRIVARKCRQCGSPRLRKTVSSFSYHPEVTLEDLGVNVVHQPAPAVPQGPPPGGCPYCGQDEDTPVEDSTKDKNGGGK